MPTDIEESQIKEYLQRADVKTMRKDLQRLREGEALEERERIVKLKTPEQEQTEKEKEEKKKTEKETMSRQEILGRGALEEKEAMGQLKEYADESEKQQIFYLEAEKLNLTKQLQTIQQEKEPPFLLEKNKFLINKRGVEKRLTEVLDQEKKIEGEQKFISESEEETTSPKQKQKLEKRRRELEEEREKIEKKRWVIEKDLEIIENQLNKNDQAFQEVLKEEDLLKQKIEGIGAQLKIIYLAISQREERKRSLEKEQKTAEALEGAEEESKRKEEITRQQWKGDTTMQTPAPVSQKEKLITKLKESAMKEEEERKKFLERVEKWAEEEKKEKK